MLGIIKLILYPISFFLTLSGVILTFFLLSNNVDVINYFAGWPARRLFLIGVSVNMSVLSLLLLLYFYVPDDRKILYGAFCSTMSILLYLSVVSNLSLFSNTLFFSSQDFNASIKPNPQDNTVAILLSAFLSRFFIRELLKTPPGKHS